MSSHFARSQVSEAVQTRNELDTSEIHNALMNSHAIVYSLEKDTWEGPFSIVYIHREDFTLLLSPPAGLSIFVTTVVKRYFPKEQYFSEPVTALHNSPDDIRSNQVSSSPDMNNSRSSDAYLSYLPPSDAHMVSSKTLNSATKSSKHSAQFKSSTIKEINGLMERGLFAVADKSKAQGVRIFGSRILDMVKRKGTEDSFEKFSLFVEGFNDKTEILTHAPTHQRASQRL